jgi:hypothetical protein
MTALPQAKRHRLDNNRPSFVATARPASELPISCILPLSKNQETQAGLEIFMPDLDEQPPKKASQSITLEWLKNRNRSLPIEVPVK